MRTYFLLITLFCGIILFTAFVFRDRLGAVAQEHQEKIAKLSKRSGVQEDQLGQVLSEASVPGKIVFNVDAEISRDVNIQGALRVRGQTIFDDGIEAPNVVYSITPGQGISLSGEQVVTIQNNGVISLQGQTGAVALTAGEGITISGTTISLADDAIPDSDEIDDVGLENAFRTVRVDGQTSVIATGADSLRFESGAGIELLTDASTNTVRITNTGTISTAAGWTDNGDSVILSTLSDLVGIGIDTPTAALDVNGSARFRGTIADVNGSTGTVGYVLTATADGVAWQLPTGGGGVTNAFVQNGNSFGANAVLGTNDTFGLVFETNGTEKMRISAGGNVGIGVTNPLGALSLPAATSSRASLSIAAGSRPVSGVMGDIYVAGGEFYFFNGSVWENLTSPWNQNGTDLYYNAGEVGLGIASPDEKLEIYQGNIRLNTGSATDGTQRKLSWYDSMERWSIGFTSNDSERALRFNSGATNVMAIDDGGNVGIGVTSPVRKLDVNGSIRVASSAQPTSPSSGDIYNDGSNLFFYDGIDWVELTAGSSSFWNQNGSSIYYSGGNVGVGTTTPGALFAVGTGSPFQVGATGNVSTSGTVTVSDLNAGGILKAGVGTGTVSLATAGTDYEVPLTFSNGITRTSNAVTLGGTLTTGTTLNTGGFDFLFTNNGSVGINVADATRSLDVNGIFRLRSTTEPVTGLVGDIYSDGTSVFFYDGTAWNDLLGGGGSSLFTDSGAVTYLTAETDDFALGGTNNSAPFFFDESDELLTLTNSTTGASFRVNDAASDTTPFLIDASGNVGIGTATPARPLTVNGAMRLLSTSTPSSPAGGDLYSDGTYLYFHNGTAFQNLSSGATLWQENGSNIYYSAGNVGIGTASVLSELQVEASADPEIRLVDTGSATTGLLANGNGLYTITNTGSIMFRTGVTANGDWASTGTERMRISSTGNVGIGQTNPQRLLHVGGTIRLDTTTEPLTAAAGDIYSNGSTLYYFDGSGWQDLLSGGGASIWTDSGTITYLSQTTDDVALGGSSSTAPFFFNATSQLLTLTNTTTGSSFRVNDQASDSSPFIINADGRVGIGNTNPTSEFDLSGAFSQRGMTAPSVSGAATGRIYFDSTLGKFRVSEDGNAFVDLVSGAASTFNFGGNTFGALATLGTNDAYNLAFETNDSVRMTVETTGDVGIGTTNPAYKLDVSGSIRSSSGGFIFPDGSIQTTAVGAGGGYWAATSTHIYNVNAGNVGVGVTNPGYKLDVAGAGRFTGELVYAGNLVNNFQNPIHYVYDSNSTSRAVLQLTANTSARNYFQMTATEGDFTTPTLSTIGAWTNINLALAPKGGGNVIIASNDLLFNDTAPELKAFNATNGNHRSVLLLTADTTARNYFQMNATEGSLTTPTISAIGAWDHVNLGLMPKGVGNVIIGANDLLFNDTAPELKAYNASNANHRSVLMLTADASARNYFQMNATEGELTVPTISAVGAWNNIHLGLTAKGIGSVLMTGRSVALSTTIPGTTVGSAHIQPSTTTAGHMTSLTFGSPAAASPGTAQAGIYVEGTSTGTIMRLATADNLTSGSKVRLTIDQSGALSTGAITSGAITSGAISATGNVSATATLSGAQVNIGTSSITNGKLRIHGTNANVANGPHQYVTTTTDSFPVFNQLNWSHDNIGMQFDAYYDGAFRSSSAGSNYQIYKINNLLNFNYASGVAAGSGVTFQPGMVMNTSGYIGLGHTAPDARLHLADNAATGAIDNLSEYQIILYDGSATSAYGMGIEPSTMWFNSGGSDFRWYAAGTQSMYLDSGNLGIGTTGAPASRLHVVGPQLRWDPSTTTTNAGILFVSGGDSYAEIRSGQVGNYGSYKPLILNSQPQGYIGIGTVNPEATLHVGYSSSAGQRSPLARFGTGIGLTSTTDTQAWFGSSNWMWNGSAWNRTASSNAVLWGTGSNAGAFEVWTTDSTSAQNTAPTNSNSRLFIANGGNVGIGTVTPSTFRLEVAGSIGPSVDNTHTLGASGRRFTEVFATNGTINTSDVRLKENVKALDYGLEELLALDTISYTWKGGDANVRKLGLIAQDVQRIMPEVVHIGNDTDKTLGVYYSDLIPVTIRAIQQQQAQIDSITGGASVPSATDLLVQSLEAGYTRLDTKATELQNQVDDVLTRLDAIEQADISVSKIAALEDRVTTNEQKIASLEAELASVSARLTDSMILNAGTVMGTATESALLSGNESIIEDLLVSGTANINNLSVSGTATIGLLSIEGLDQEGNVRIDTLGGALKLQSLKQGAIELMGGEVTITTDGTMTVAGTVEATEVKTEDLRLDTAAGSAGTATIPSGEQSITVNSALVESTSRIMITETTESFSIFVVPEKKAGESFTVKMNGVKSEAVTFDWILVNE